MLWQFLFLFVVVEKYHRCINNNNKAICMVQNVKKIGKKWKINFVPDSFKNKIVFYGFLDCGFFFFSFSNEPIRPNLNRFFFAHTIDNSSTQRLKWSKHICLFSIDWIFFQSSLNMMREMLSTTNIITMGKEIANVNSSTKYNTTNQWNFGNWNQPKWMIIILIQKYKILKNSNEWNKPLMVVRLLLFPALLLVQSSSSSFWLKIVLVFFSWFWMILGWC